MFKHVYVVLISSLIVTLSRSAPQVRQTPARATAVKDAYQVAEQRCAQYSEARYINKTIQSFVPGRPPTIRRVLECVKTEKLIVGGRNAGAMEFPHMALIGYHDTVPSPEYERWLCGGTLISERFVLSAAHCTTDGLPARWVRLGELEIGNDNDKSSPRDFRIAQRIPHPKYRTSSVYHDIALFRLERAVTFNQYMRPICLHTARTLPNYYGDKAVITGWGTTGYGERQSEHLLKAVVNFIIESDCKRNYANDNMLKNGFDSATMVCAGNKANVSDTCEGDSGGPIQVPMTDWTCMWSQIGVTSYGSASCGNKAIPAIYTRVAYYIPWIQPIVWP